ncbi:MAG: DUF2336 domain-containing protein [Caulobacteraceae bacterium]|nr:DUF2336 domain-containing protein [Caulobacter sp.]
MTGRAAFSDEDIRQLLRGPTDEDRAVVAHRLCRRIDTSLTDQERAAAAEVLRLMAADAAELVRRALAVTLRRSPHLPRDVALKLSADIDSIAAPVIAASPAFTDADLCEILRAAGEAKQVAVASRERLTETVTNTLAVHACEPALKLAVANDNAAFTERALRITLDRFAASTELTEGMAARAVLPAAISERLVTMVSEEARRRLVDRHALAPDLAMRIALGAQERATVDLVDQAGRTQDVGAFVEHLHRSGRLTPSLLLRTLAHGHMAFVEHGLARMAELPHHRAWLLVHDAGPLGLKAICQKAGLPPRLHAAFRAGVDTFRSLQFEGVDAETFQRRMLERFLTQPASPPEEEVDYLLDRMDQLSETPAVTAAALQAA